MKREGRGDPPSRPAHPLADGRGGMPDTTKRYHVQKLRDVNGLAVWIVDGNSIRRELDIDFTNFGQHHRFPFIPADEFWLDVEHHAGEDEFYIRHLLVEKRHMDRGASYARALAYANRAERAERLKSVKVVEFLSLPSGGSRLAQIHREPLEASGPNFRVWLVDGELVRATNFLDFTEGGHDQVYPFVPASEVWIDDDLVPEERPYVILHELHERQLMAAGWKYPAAHAAASEVESLSRRDPTALPELLRAARLANSRG